MIQHIYIHGIIFYMHHTSQSNVGKHTNIIMHGSCQYIILETKNNGCLEYKRNKTILLSQCEFRILTHSQTLENQWMLWRLKKSGFPSQKWIRRLYTHCETRLRHAPFWSWSFFWSQLNYSSQMWCFNIQPERCLTRILKAASHLSSAFLPQARDIGRYVKTTNNQ